MKRQIARTLRLCGSAVAAAKLHAVAAARGTQCRNVIDPTAAVSPAIRLAIGALPASLV